MTDPSPPEADPPEPRSLRHLRRLVTALTAVMIVGITAIVVLLAIRLAAPLPAAPLPALPEAVRLPDGARAAAVTFGPGWVAVVTDAQEILVYDAVTGALRASAPVTADGQPAE